MDGLTKMDESHINALYLSFNDTKFFKDIEKVGETYFVDEDGNEATIEDGRLVDQFYCPCCEDRFTEKEFFGIKVSRPICCYITIQKIAMIDLGTTIVLAINTNNIVMLEHMLSLDELGIDPSDYLDSLQTCSEASESTRDWIIEKINEEDE